MEWEQLREDQFQRAVEDTGGVCYLAGWGTGEDQIKALAEMVRAVKDV